MKKKYYLLLFGVLAFFFVQFYLSSQPTRLSSDREASGDTTSLVSSPRVSVVSIHLFIGDERIGLSAPTGSTLYEMLVLGKREGKIDFGGHEYLGLGFFVTRIGLFSSSDTKFLMYFINNKEATVGVSSYVPRDGDTIEWKLQ